MIQISAYYSCSNVWRRTNFMSGYAYLHVRICSIQSRILSLFNIKTNKQTNQIKHSSHKVERQNVQNPFCSWVFFPVVVFLFRCFLLVMLFRIWWSLYIVLLTIAHLFGFSVQWKNVHVFRTQNKRLVCNTKHFNKA